MAKASVKETVDPKTGEVTEVVKNQLPASLQEAFMADSGKGNENVGQGDLIAPFYKILDGQSGEVKKTKAQYVEGAEEGMIFNTLTKELIDGKKGIVVVPAFYDRFEIEWKPIEVGGLVAIHPHDTPLLKQVTKGGPNGTQNILPNGNLLMTTAQHYVVRVKDDQTFDMGIISMASTRLKKSRMWNSLIEGIQLKGPNGQSFNPPRFSHMYRLTTTPESKGTQAWWTWNIELLGPVTSEEIYKAARKLFVDVNSGAVKAVPIENEGAAAPQPGQNDDFPF